MPTERGEGTITSSSGGRLRRFIWACLLFAACSFFARAAAIPCIWTNVEKIVAVGDLHGDYDNFVVILKGTGIIDADLRWSGGKTHLVQTGDILDRGTQAKDILDLLIRLEKEAAAAGGMVHVLLGNHEEMNITGIALDYPDYVTVEQFVSFLPADVRTAREKEFLARLSDPERARVEKLGLDLATNQALRDFWQSLERRSGDARRAYVAGFNSAYGPWLLQKNAVIKINDIVFAHAGVSDKYSGIKIEDINSTLRRELQFFQGFRRNPQDISSAFRPTIVYDSESPLWFRGLGYRDETASSAEVNRILARLQARFMVIGHDYFAYGGGSPVIRDLGNISRYNGKVYIIDTGISHAYGGVTTALVIDQGRFSLWEPEEAGGEPSMKTTHDAAPPPAFENVEKFLKTAPITNVRKTDMPGRTEPWRVVLSDGHDTRRAIFKYIDRRRPSPLADSYHYELAAYEISKFLGLSLVPAAVERQIEDMPGSLSLFIENSFSESDRKSGQVKPADPESFSRAMADLRVFISLVNDTCANDQDVLIRKDDWAVFRVDFSQAFAPGDKDALACKIDRCSRKLYRKLAAWEDKTVSQIMAPYLSQGEIQGLQARRRLLVKTIAALIKERGEEAVLF